MTTRQSDYRARHPDRVRESQRRWRENNQERVRAYNKEYKRRKQKGYRQQQKVALWRETIGVWNNETTGD